jgi:dihydropteroate synthase
MSTPKAPTWRTARFELVLDRPRVMAIVNVTPDSFATGSGSATAAELARTGIEHAEAQARAGAGHRRRIDSPRGRAGAGR